jgi:hypothetical protein
VNTEGKRETAQIVSCGLTLDSGDAERSDSLGMFMAEALRDNTKSDFFASLPSTLCEFTCQPVLLEFGTGIVTDVWVLNDLHGQYHPSKVTN